MQVYWLMRSIFIALLFLTFPLYSQKNSNYNSAEIKEALKKLNILGNVLYLAAHPDDENTRLITYLSKENLYNTYYLSLTRGDGGQNLIGPELNEKLGIIRTQELLEARKLDGGKQYFSRAIDFGFSKNPDETFEVWNREEVLADVVWVIRNTSPDVIITRFNTEPGRTHGHHTASTILALDAFDAAADPKRFPEQLAYVEIWQAERILWNTSSWFYLNTEQFDAAKDSMLKIDVGAYNQVLGKSYSEIAAESRSMHKSQGFGASGSRGSSMEYLQHFKGSKAQDDLFDKINTSWSRVKNSDDLSIKIENIVKNFNSENPSAIVPDLLKVRKHISGISDEFWRTVKLKEVDKLIKSCLGLWIEVLSEEASATPGQTIQLKAEVINRSSFPAVLSKVQFNPKIKDSTVNLNLKNNIDYQLNFTVTLPETLMYTQPYWLVKQGSKGMFEVDKQELIGLPENPPALEALFSFKLEDQLIEYSLPIVFKKVDPVKAELYQALEIVPPVFINPTENLIIFANSKPKKIGLRVKAGKESVSGIIKLTLPSGWKSIPSAIPFVLNNKGDVKAYDVTIYPSDNAMQGELEIKAIVANDTISWGLTEINYDHIPYQRIFPTSTVKVTRLDLKKRGQNIGYINGAGDGIPLSLQHIGYQVTVINDLAMTTESLKKYDAIVVGIRALNMNEAMRNGYTILLNYVKNGGTLIVQYNTMPNRVTTNVFKTDSIGPYPFKLSSERVTKEEAEVRFLNPKHSLLNTPNKITEADFDDWVQERGLYFPNEWSKEYETIVSFNDPGESPKDGSILYANYGKGVFIYTSLSWFRQLPAGVPGAYRLFVNLLSAKKR